MKRKPSKPGVSGSKEVPQSYCPSHTRFIDLIGYCTQGTSNPAMPYSGVNDHFAEITELHLDDVDSLLWFPSKSHEGPVLREMLNKLEERIFNDNEMLAAEILYAVATEAAHGVLHVYLRKRELFDKITPHRKFLPSLFSIHPNTAKLVGKMFEDSKLGSQTDHAGQVGSRAYFVNDSPANIYARTIIESVKFNRKLKPLICQQNDWKEFDKKEGVQTVLLPFPKYIEMLDRLPIPITPESVMDYWRTGKKIILEEMPGFQDRPEWASYRRRKYKSGAKPGVIQHAIFKDILTALKTIAGAKRRKTAAARAKSAGVQS